MNCKECSNRLIDFLDGFLPHDKIVKMEEHLHQCEVCRAKLKRIENTLGVLKQDKIPQLSEAKKRALFPLVMERVEQRTKRNVRMRRRLCSWSLVSTLLLIFIITILTFHKHTQIDIYTVFVNPENLMYESDPDIDNYLLESLIETDTIISDIRTTLDEEWIDDTELAVLVNRLSEDEMDKLVEKLKTIDFIDIL